METLTLKNLRFRAFHGYYEEERRDGNDFEIDLIFTADLRPAGDSDDLDDTINYQEVLKIVEAVINGPSVKLIETLAKQIGDQLFEHFLKAEKLEVIVRKLRPPLKSEVKYSEITMSWQR